jgi:transketolase
LTSAIGSRKRISVPKLKPLDSKKLLVKLEQFRKIVTIEEHSIHGGLGACIAEHIMRSDPKKIFSIGVRDRFSQKCGSYEYLLKEAGLDEESMFASISKFLEE